MNETKFTAMKMMNANSAERKEAEKMMGCKFEDMSKEQRVLAAICLAAFDGVRHKAIVRLLADILIDLEICELEGWDKQEYINKLKEQLDSIGLER